MGAYQNTETGEYTFTTDYIGAWYEQQNRAVLNDMRYMLDVERQSLYVVFQPGDGTRYEFILTSLARQFEISSDGREPKGGHPNGDVLVATIANRMGSGVGTFNRLHSDGDREYIMRSIRYRINEKMDVPNPCTVEAFAATIFALWYMDD